MTESHATNYDVIIIGAGAAGLMCAAVAGQRGRRVLVLDHAKRAAEKIRISGGGRCNFTNIHTDPSCFLSQNPHFCKSALSCYTPYDFIDLVEKHGIAYHEKKLGQLFCDHKSQDIIDMLLSECAAAGVKILMEVTVQSVESGFVLHTSNGKLSCDALVIATGGLSIPKIGASPFGYKIAEQFGHGIIPTRAGLVPLTFQNNILEMCKGLTGVSVEASISNDKAAFAEGMLFTHRGLSGPSVLQISSYWREKETVTVNLAPDTDMLDYLKSRKQETPKQDVQNAIADVLPKRLANALCDINGISGRLADLPDARLRIFADAVNQWVILPDGTEGYRTAEVTLGGVDTNALSSKTMESHHQSGLFFIGEVVDVTGWLGGYNFQWAWSSAYAAGQHV